MPAITAHGVMRLNPQAMKMIEDALYPLIRKGCRIGKLKMHVSQDSKLATESTISTRFGPLRIKVNCYVPKGMAYIIEDRCKGFSWVRKNPKTEKKAAHA